jgi:GNAT superfamily N-acetyltransferase
MRQHFTDAMAFVITQQEINRRTFEVAPHPRVAPTVCDQCGSAGVYRILSHEINRGRMFIVGSGSPAFDPSAVLVFCRACYPHWLMWQARMGYDLHEHRSNAPCQRPCIAKAGGRRAQFEAQMSLLTDRSESAGFFAQKQIDGLPRVNGSYLLMGQRTARFMYRMVTRQQYYESTSDAAEVKRQFLRAAQMHRLRVARAADHILISVEAFQSWYDAPRGAIALPGVGDASIGHHCVYLSGYEDHGNRFRFANSWGQRWGNRGYGTLSYEYLTRYLQEAFVLRIARYGPAAWNFSKPEAGVDPDEFRRRMRLEAPRQRIRRRRSKGENWVIEVFETASPTTGYPVLCVEIQNGFGLKLGWAFFRQNPIGHTRILEITELFVWPTFRRMGIGRMLDEIAIEYAEAYGCGEIHLMMNEADAVLNPPDSPRTRARSFGGTLGYEWRWRNNVAPRRPATGVKRLAT